MTHAYQNLLRQRRAVRGALLLFQRSRLTDATTAQYWLGRAAYYMVNDCTINEIIAIQERF